MLSVTAFDDLQTAAVLGGCGHRIAGKSSPVKPFLAGPAAALDGTGPAAGIDHLDNWPAWTLWRETRGTPTYSDTAGGLAIH
jgi:hypothetical protein